MKKFPERHKSRGNPSGGRGGPSETRRPQRGPAVPAAARAEPQCPAAPPGAAVPPRRGRPPSLSLPPSGRASPAPGHLPLLRPPRAVPRDAAGGGSSPALFGARRPSSSGRGCCWAPWGGAASRRAGPSWLREGATAAPQCAPPQRPNGAPSCWGAPLQRPSVTSKDSMLWLKSLPHAAAVPSCVNDFGSESTAVPRGERRSTIATVRQQRLARFWYAQISGCLNSRKWQSSFYF